MPSGKLEMDFRKSSVNPSFVECPGYGRNSLKNVRKVKRVEYLYRIFNHSC